MNRGEFFRDQGYYQGLIDGKRTKGKIRDAYVRNLLESETQNLSEGESREYETGWQDGYTEAVSRLIRNNVGLETFSMFQVVEVS